MNIRIMDNYSDEDFKQIVAESTSLKDCLANLGYNSFSGTTNAKNPQHKEHKLNYCVDCGAPISKKLQDVFNVIAN